MKKKISQYSVAELEREIKRHNELYFKKAAPIISDEEFDRLVERLKNISPQSPVLQEVGSDLTVGAVKVEHSSPMLSLDKCYHLEDLLRWSKKFEGPVMVSPKIDGLAIALRYGEEGRLQIAETRGDGFKGEDILANVLQIRAIPVQLNEASLEVRGEVYMALSVFKKFKETFANPRNLASGALKQKNPKKTADYHLSFFAYDLMGADYQTEEEKFLKLSQMGFPTVEHQLYPKDPALLQKVYDQWRARREELDYEVDGVVYRVNLVEEQTRLGASAHHPRWAMAYKFQGESKTSLLQDIEWSVSRNGTLTPIGLVSPVELSGATVKRVTLHNAGMVAKKGATPGAEVLLVRSGGVIPKLEKVLKPGKKKLEIPKKCPSCGSPTLMKEDFLFCTQPKTCRSSRLGALRHFVDVLEIEGFGEKLLEQLLDQALLEGPADLFNLTLNDLMPLERMGEKLAKKLLGQVEKAREVSLESFLRALAISELGKHVAKVLVKNFSNLERILKLKEEDLAEIATIGPIIAKKVTQGLKEKGPLIKRLLKEIRLKEKTRLSQGPLSGKSFLFTGALSKMTRSEAQKKVEDLGGESLSAVSQNLDYLVVGQENYEQKKKGNKWLKAESLMQKGAPIQIIKEEDFLKLIKEKS